MSQTISSGKGGQRITIPTKKVRVSYVNFVEPRAVGDDPGAPKRYSASLIIEPEDVNEIWAAICQAADANWSDQQMTGAQKLNAKMIHSPLRNGAEKPTDAAYAGKFFLNATSKTPPICFEADGRTPKKPSEIYSGCYVRAVLNFYKYDRPQRKGIAVGIQYVQFWENGEPLGGGGSIQGGQQLLAGLAPIPTAAPGAMPGMPGGPAPGYGSPPGMPGGYPPNGGAPGWGAPPPAGPPAGYGAPAPSYGAPPQQQWGQMPPAAAAPAGPPAGYGAPPAGYGAPPAGPPQGYGQPGPTGGAPPAYAPPAYGAPAGPPGAPGYAPPQQPAPGYPPGGYPAPTGYPGQ